MSLVRNPKVISRALDDETALLNPESGYLHILNSTGTDIWNLLDRCHSLDDMTKEMGLMYEGQVDMSSLSQDVEELLAELREHRLVIELDQ